MIQNPHLDRIYTSLDIVICEAEKIPLLKALEDILDLQKEALRIAGFTAGAPSARFSRAVAAKAYISCGLARKSY